jgi:DNA end-binding protein Ku
MAARSIWKGAISFGMVSIPIALYSAAQSKDLSFNMLHKECNSRIKQVRRCPVDEVDLDAGDIVKGFEYAKGQYVILTDEDFEKVSLPSKHTIEVIAFVEEEDIDPVYYEKSYFLQPEELGVKPYALLLRAMQDKKLNALGKISFRNREHLCAMRPSNGTIVLDTLYYADEVQVEKPKKVEDVELSERELGMAHSLIDLLAEPFDPSKYHDEYREALMEVIEAKLNGEELVSAPAPAEERTVDLLAALKASIEAAQKQQGDGTDTELVASHSNGAA